MIMHSDYGVRDLIADVRAFYGNDERRWIWGTIARDGSGEICDPNAPEAVRWCALGAMCALANVDAFYHLPRPMRRACDSLIANLSVSDIPQFNDRCDNLAEMLAALDAVEADVRKRYIEQRDIAWRAAFAAWPGSVDVPEMRHFYAACACELHAESL